MEEYMLFGVRSVFKEFLTHLLDSMNSQLYEMLVPSRFIGNPVLSLSSPPGSLGLFFSLVTMKVVYDLYGVYGRGSPVYVDSPARPLMDNETVTNSSI